MAADLSSLGSRDLSALFRASKLSPVEVAAAHLRRAEANAHLNIFSVLEPADTLAMARESEARWAKGEPLSEFDGVPVTIKDVLLTRGWPTLNGSLTTEKNQDWSTDAPCVARLREAGCVFLGKTTTSEFGWKGVNDSPLHGPTRNPWNPSLTTGGSSGGAGAAATLNLGVWHAATDAAGSIRIPAAFCGVYGFKPTYGVVPIFPHSVFSGLTHCGPIARSVAEIVEMMRIISRPDPRDPTAAPAGTCSVSGTPDFKGRDHRIAYVRDRTIDVQPEVDLGVEHAVNVWSGLGVAVETVEYDFTSTREAIQSIWRVGCMLRVEEIAPTQRALLDPGLLRIAELGLSVTAAELRRAQLEAVRLGHKLHNLLTSFKLLMTPTVPVTAFPVGHDVPPDSGLSSWLEWAPLSYPFNMTQQPTISLPCGLTREGMPRAVQIIGQRYDDVAVLNAAAGFSKACPAPYISTRSPA
jgi:aspartyl-tRNA(Asn)/glutamyl-tRNA(Gln) amidotransferase subunit A